MNEDTNIHSATAPQKGRQRNLGAAQSVEISGSVLRPASAERRGREKAAEPTVIGCKVRLARKPVCHDGICIIAAANEPYAGELICANCGRHCAWLSHKVVKFIEETQRRFGAPEIMPLGGGFAITIGTPLERSELGNRDYDLPDGARVEIVNSAHPPRLYLSRPFGALPTPNKKGKLCAAKTQAKLIAVGKTYREIADAVAFLSERYGKHNVHIMLKQRQEVPKLTHPEDDAAEPQEHETQSPSAAEQEVHMRASDMFPSKYLKSADVKSKPITATISHLTQELVGQGKDAEKKPILHFKDAKAMVLNKTNAVTLDAAFGDTDNWSGKKIRIHCVETAYGGRAIDGIRVKPLAVAKPAAEGASPEFNDEVGL